MDRRGFLTTSCALGLGSLLPVRAFADDSEAPILTSRVLTLEGDPKLARRALLLRPSTVAPTTSLPLLVLLHGLGETDNEQAGLEAWSKRYGLISAYERLSRPPVKRILGHARYFPEKDLTDLNASLLRDPFTPFVTVCPITPNVYKSPNPRKALDRYAEWITSVLLPQVRAHCSISNEREAVSLDGCSLGGYIALEIFKRRPQHFGALGMVQGAISVGSVKSYATGLVRAIEEHGSVSVRLGTSSADPYQKANEALARELRKLGQPCTLETFPGPHDQPWLREVGTLAMLRWHERRFNQARGAAAPR